MRNRDRERIEQWFADQMRDEVPGQSRPIDVTQAVMKQVDALPTFIEMRRVQLHHRRSVSVFTATAAACLAGILVLGGVFRKASASETTSAVPDLTERLYDAYSHCYEYDTDAEEAVYYDNPLALFY